MNGLSQTGSYLTLRLGGEVFALPVEKVLEIIEVSQITRIPQTDSWVRGVTNLRGSVLPVIETRLKFGMESVPDSVDTCIVVLSVNYENETVQLGALVDSVVEVTTLEPDTIKAKPSIGRKYANEFITGIAHAGDRFILLLDADRVFNTEEIVQLHELTATVETA